MFIKLPNNSRINIDYISSYVPVDTRTIVIRIGEPENRRVNFESERDNYLSYLDACCGVHQS